MVPENKLSKEEEGAKVDGTLGKKIMESLMYMTITKPGLTYNVNVCLISSFMSNPIKTHMLTVKRFLRYIQDIIFFVFDK